MSDVIRGKRPLQLIVKNTKQSLQQILDVVQGAGDDGKTLRIKAESSTTYELYDRELKRAPEKVRAKRSGRDLEIFFEGSASPEVVIEAYYDEAIVEFPKDT